MTTSIDVGFDAVGLNTAYPFHFVIDAQDQIIQVGRSMAKLLPELNQTANMCDLIHVTSPVGPMTHSHLSKHPGRLIILTLSTQDNLTIRAQAIPGINGSLIVIGSPWFTEMSQVGACGLSLADFAAHESVTDLLLILQTQASSLTDATNMADAFGALNQQLEMRVHQRTQDLQEKTNALLQEIHDRQRIESELRLAQKLESVGQLAAGIAHEINTPIQFIGDNLRFIGDSLIDLMSVFGELTPLLTAIESANCATIEASAMRSASDKADLPYLKVELPKAVAQSLEGIQRVAELVRALKEFSHPDGGEHKSSDLNRAVENALVVARNEYKYVADAIVNCDPKLPQVVCNIGEINQVLLNLIVNAGHAIGDTSSTKGRGTITLSTRKDGDFVEISISDTGTGIPESARTKIFDPFFTTKPVGKGTGQGLYLVHAMVTKRHRGSIRFTTETGVGATFFVRLPIASASTVG